MYHRHLHRNNEISFWKARPGVALLMLAIIGFFYLAREHYGHLLQGLPYIILLLCPLLHLFGHNHGGRSNPTRVSKDKDRK
ncbi:MAG: DUF2933 domain-containing protein [Pseudomonas stutzeri]|nr:DUF2933 domain-containing protein [Stutzerimonas stutzeri]